MDDPMSAPNDAVIVMARRSPVAKAFKGSFAETRPDDLAAQTIQKALADLQLDTKYVEDIYLGCAMTEGEQGYNIARQVSLLAGLPDEIGAMTVNRFCSSSAQTASPRRASRPDMPSASCPPAPRR
jgi:acetyl-CoA acyltransferase